MIGELVATLIPAGSVSRRSVGLTRVEHEELRRKNRELRTGKVETQPPTLKTLSQLKQQFENEQDIRAQLEYLQRRIRRLDLEVEIRWMLLEKQAEQEEAAEKAKAEERAKHLEILKFQKAYASNG